jgi:acetyl-CoA C-acetyltransferase
LPGKPLATIVSAGLSKFGRREGLYARELFAEAALSAFHRVEELDPAKDIKAAFIGQMSEAYEHQAHNAPIEASWAGLFPAPAMRVENACASSGSALRCGIMAIMSNLYDIVLVGGVEKMTNQPTPEVTGILANAADYPFEQWNGMTFPGLFALMATAHMHDYGTSEEQLAAVAVKNHKNGALNPKAHMQKEVSMDEVLKSRVVSWPLKLYDCSLITDGASCVILSKPKLAKKLTDNYVHIIGTGQSQDTFCLHERESLTTVKAAKTAAMDAYKMSGVKPKDVNVAELHDCFTIAEIIGYEDLGFCRPGQGGKYVESGATALDGTLPVNTSGGLKSKGHPVGATGTAQIHELYLQLTDQADRRQVSGAKIGLAHNLGGSGATAVVHILKGT